MQGGVFYLFVVFPLETAISALSTCSTCKQCGTSSSARTAIATGNNTGIVVGIDSIPTDYYLQVHFFAILGLLSFCRYSIVMLRRLQANKTCLCVQNFAFLCQPTEISNISTRKNSHLKVYICT